MDNVYPSSHPLVSTKLTLLRDVSTEPKKFRELVREIAAMLAYEATLDLATRPIEVQTPLAIAKGKSPRACFIVRILSGDAALPVPGPLVVTTSMYRYAALAAAARS